MNYKICLCVFSNLCGWLKEKKIKQTKQQTTEKEHEVLCCALRPRDVSAHSRPSSG